ncbi:MAG TPA: aconitase X catalytic domain-containing protein [Thermoplasmata archaeon]|nr:aconitase X catalytic domain-containing protein [Thermoplasmata archaeon]
MHLTADEERTLAGEEGLGRQRAIELLVALGDIYGAEGLVPIASAQVSGASYKTIGDAGIGWLEDMAQEARASVRATVNPLGMDLRRWRSMGIDPKFQAKQIRITAAYLAMGLEPLYSCTPYLSGNRPKRGQHLAWAESSATVFANSYLGAKTNREGGPSALAAAIIGKTAMYGLHLDENRTPKVRIVLDEIGPGYVPLAGYLVGKVAGNRIPEIQCDKLTPDEHKSFGAALAATSGVSMYVHRRRGDERGPGEGCIEEVVEIGADELSRCAEDLSGDDDWDLAAVGCPHCSPKELRRMATVLKGRKPRKECDVWFCTSRSVYAQCPEAVRTLKRFGKVLCDTCMVVSPIEEMFKRTVTDSGKAMVYLPTLGRQRASFRTTDQLLEAISR